MTYKITLIPGDGVGPEVTEATRRVLEASGVSFHWDLAYIGSSAQNTLGTPLPDSVLESIRKNRVALKGPVTTPVGSGFRSVNVALPACARVKPTPAFLQLVKMWTSLL